MPAAVRSGAGWQILDDPADPAQHRFRLGFLQRNQALRNFAVHRMPGGSDLSQYSFRGASSGAEMRTLMAPGLSSTPSGIPVDIMHLDAPELGVCTGRFRSYRSRMIN